MKITFDAENHLYFNADGFIVPSVTEIISSVYGSGIEAAPVEFVQRAAAKGKKIHSEIEQYVKSGKAAKDMSAETQFFIDYAEKNLNLKVFAKAEMIVHATTPTGEFCGTLDLFCGGYIFDYKTSRTASREQIAKWQMQLSFYYFALKQAGKSVLGIKVLHLTADGCKEIPLEYLGDDFVLKTMALYSAGEKAEKTAPATELQTVDTAAIAKFAETVKQIKMLEEQTAAIKEAIKAEMESRNILNLQVGDVAISYVSPTVRKSFDSAKFKAEHSDLWPLYQKESKIAGSIRIKVD